MLVTMTHHSQPGVERVVSRDAYRWVWWAEGWRSTDDPDWSGPPPTGARSPGQTIQHNWVRDGWTPWVPVLVNPSDDTVLTDTVTEGRGRITGSGTGGNRREWRLRRSTNWVDSEIVSLWWGGSVFDTNVALPQMGHVHRAQRDHTGRWRAVVVTNNIFLSQPNTINQNVWESEDDTLTLGSNGQSKAFGLLDRSLNVTAVQRISFGGWINQHVVTPAHLYGLEVGVACDVTSLDSTFAETGAAVSAVAHGLVTFTEPTTESSVAKKVDSGAITPTNASGRRYWPYWVRSQLRGDVLRVKAWRHMDTEPDWGTAASVQTVDFADEAAPGPNATMPTGPGLCGLVGAHLRNDAYMEYGATAFTGI